jgi:murein L,D-transpeptidase YcbB/YkuD
MNPLMVLHLCVLSLVLPAAATTPDPAGVQRALHHPPSAAGHEHFESYLPAASRFYGDREYKPLWTGEGGLGVRGRSVLAALQKASAEGLDAGEYLAGTLDTLSRMKDAESAANLEVLLTLASLRFAHDLGWGVSLPREADRSTDYARAPFRGDSVLVQLASTTDPGAYLLQLAPLSTPYRNLRLALSELRAIEANGGWTANVPARPAVRPGARGPRVAQLRTLLAERGDLPAHLAPGDSFDLPLSTALIRFQMRHGLPQDTVFGAAVAEELNVPLPHRIEQVRLGMERMRWLPHNFSGRWISSNLADFQATVWDGESAVFTSRAVIGRKYHETPLFNGTMTYVVINPYWNVPSSITRKEILPKLKRDPGYLARNNMERVNGGIRQLPGDDNALGRFKFMFPNSHNVYMHDTPSKALFERDSRAFSHGCVRLQRPAELAELLLRDQGWTAEKIQETVASGRRTVVPLRTPIPVYIYYATAFHGLDGLLHYRKDIYGRDAKLAAALARRGEDGWDE